MIVAVGTVGHREGPPVVSRLVARHVPDLSCSTCMHMSTAPSLAACNRGARAASERCRKHGVGPLFFFFGGERTTELASLRNYDANFGRDVTPYNFTGSRATTALQDKYIHIHIVYA